MDLPNLIHLKRWKEVLEKVSSNPDELCSWDNGGFLPIHNACFLENVPLNVIESFLEVYPESVKQKSQTYSLLPLHCAVHNYSSTNSEVVKLLLASYKEGALAQEENGRTPLIYHLLVCQSPSLEMTKMLADAHPDAVRICDSGKWNPLHYAAYRGNWEISQYIIDMYPDALTEENNDNRTPRDITVCNGRNQMAEKFLEAEEDIQSGMMKITVERDESVHVMDDKPEKSYVKDDIWKDKSVDSLSVESYSSENIISPHSDNMNSDKTDVIQNQHPVQNKDYSYSRSMHDRLVYDWN